MNNDSHKARISQYKQNTERQKEVTTIHERNKDTNYKTKINKHNLRQSSITHNKSRGSSTERHP